MKNIKPKVAKSVLSIMGNLEYDPERDIYDDVIRDGPRTNKFVISDITIDILLLTHFE